MPRPRFVPPRQPMKEVLPFTDAEEAWFWFMRSQMARDAGAKGTGFMNEKARPCDPDDIYRAVIGLARCHVINRSHLKVLASFGVLGWSPDPRLPEQQRQCLLWNEAMDRLTTVLKSKDIIQ